MAGRDGRPRHPGGRRDPRRRVRDRGRGAAARGAQCSRARAGRGGGGGPHRADAAPGAAPGGRGGPGGPDPPGRRPGRAAAPPRRQRRRADLYLPAQVRAGPAGDAGRAGPGAQTRRDDGQPGVLRADRAAVASGLVGVHPDGTAGRRPAARRPGVVPGGPLPRPQHLRALPQVPGRLDGAGVGEGGAHRRPDPGDEPRRRPGHVGYPPGGYGGAESPPMSGGGLGGVDPPEETRPAYYAAGPGRWRDWWTLLHPPYTAWHLSYAVIGAALAPQVLVSNLVATVLA